MDWLRIHPYTSALTGAGILIVIGAFIVITKSTAAPSDSQPRTWGGTGTIFGALPDQNTVSQNQGTGGIIQQVQNSAPYTYIPITAPQDGTPEGGVTDGFDFDAFVSLLSAGNKSASSSTTGGAKGSIYSFIPGGFVSTTTQKTRSALQQKLFDYGNDVGSYIQSFEQQYPNATQILTDQVQDRNDSGKADRVISLGKALSGLGENLLAMDSGASADEGGNLSVPSQMRPAHKALAESYVDLGKKLTLVPGEKSDTDFISAISTYNASVDTFTKNYVALANLFVSYGVSFSPGDPGSLFTFSQAEF